MLEGVFVNRNERKMEKRRDIKHNEEDRQRLVSYFKSFEQEISGEEVSKRWDKLVDSVKMETATRNYRLRRIYISVASVAAIIICVICGLSVYRNYYLNSMDYMIAKLDDNSIDTVNQVVLITQSNQKIEAGKDADIIYSSKGHVSVNKRRIEDAAPKVEYNQLIVPKGKSSSLVLADGTSLNVNAGTKVVYPSVFTGNRREIYVDGEIYIDVKKDPSKPFIVKTSGFDVRVTGTAFNVNAYKSFNESEVVLVRGSIVVTDCNKKEIQVKPNELIHLVGNVASSKREVDANEYTAWTKGCFPLQGRSMESILKRLSFYYGCEVTCDDYVKSVSLHGTIDMSVDLPKVLERIAKLYPISVVNTENGYYLHKNKLN